MDDSMISEGVYVKAGSESESSPTSTAVCSGSFLRAVELTVKTEVVTEFGDQGVSSVELDTTGSSISTDSKTPRRRSTRDIKRPKFDDEIVESSVPTKSPRKHHRPSGGHNRQSLSPVDSRKPSPVLKKEPMPASPSDSISDSSGGRVRKKKPSRAGAGSSSPSIEVCSPSSDTLLAPVQVARPLKPPSHGGKSLHGKVGVERNLSLTTPSQALEHVGRWTATDDLALITAIMQVSDLRKVHAGVKFSCHFTLEEIQERWYALLYDSHMAKLSVETMKQLAPEQMASIQSRTLFSKAEEQILKGVAEASQPTVATFQELLLKHPETFHHARTPRSLLSHWQQLKEHKLLGDQRLLPWPGRDHKELSFSDLEDSLEAEPGQLDPMAEMELLMAERRLNRQIRTLDNELPKWQVLVESVTGISPPDFDPHTMAVLRGRLVRFLVRSREISLGRHTRHSTVDIDLSLEGPAAKISRKQATIKMRSTGDFYIINEGKRPVYVDGKPLLPGSKTQLDNNAVIEVSSIRLVFLVNQDLLSTLRTEATKMIIS